MKVTVAQESQFNMYQILSMRSPAMGYCKHPHSTTVIGILMSGHDTLGRFKVVSSMMKSSAREKIVPLQTLQLEVHSTHAQKAPVHSYHHSYDKGNLHTWIPKEILMSRTSTLP